MIAVDIEVIRALTGNYHDIVFNRDGFKCYGYRAGDDTLKNLGIIEKDDVDTSVIFNFLRKDIVAFQPYYESDRYDIIIRKDGKTLRLEKSIISKPDNKLIKLITMAIRKSLLNFITNYKGILEINLENDRISVIDKANNKVVFKFWHYLALGDMQVIDYLLDNVLKHDDIKINYLFDKPISVYITVFNVKILLSGSEKNVTPLIIKCADYKESLKNINRHQLKMEGF